MIVYDIAQEVKQGDMLTCSILPTHLNTKYVYVVKISFS